MEIKTEEYSINYDDEHHTIYCKGSLLLSGSEEYAPLLELMLGAIEKNHEGKLQLNVQELEFLNSSGINTMTKFVINARNQKTVNLTVTGYAEIPWQVRLLKNLQRLMPNLELVLI
ncbi:slr1659 superfamily regulator [Candidatus Venteria ishoeyi]|uniref:STAS domain-containing protein n=1 Tax=Candidatus Venteria ishoeyi TaxID=1899563 RepID=A0A1H6F9N5_9GAMM|nr:hypothetical protein [Candidatus Venteria ishoeyi]MDM8546499.1 hypothetical protein [Candidatus Venteria ishoeyi]SEH06323.1 Uncharacterised protein [Candidatus Venteria ishoeyi]